MDHVKARHRCVDACLEERRLGLRVVRDKTALVLDDRCHSPQDADEPLGVGSAVPVRNGQAQLARKKRDLDAARVVAEFSIPLSFKQLERWQDFSQPELKTCPELEIGLGEWRLTGVDTSAAAFSSSAASASSQLWSSAFARK